MSYIISGSLKIRMDDGSETEIGPGDVCPVPPGHDAWVIGNETCVGIDITGTENYGIKK